MQVVILKHRTCVLDALLGQHSLAAVEVGDHVVSARHVPSYDTTAGEGVACVLCLAGGRKDSGEHGSDGSDGKDRTYDRDKMDTSLLCTGRSLQRNRIPGSRNQGGRCSGCLHILQRA